MTKEKEKLNHLSLDLSFENIRPVENTGFARGECRVAYGGKNRNYTDIPKEVFGDAEKTVFGVPVVGNWIEDSSEEYGGRFGGHDVILEQKGNEIIIKDNTVPFGFVPQDANPRWVDFEDENGNSKSYYTVDVILWAERYPEQIESIKEKGVNQSMEIMVTDGEWDDNWDYFNINEFYYSALCLLGKDTEDPSKNVEPCFEESSVSVGEFSFNKDFALQISELKAAFEGGGTIMEDKKTNQELEVEENDVEEEKAEGEFEEAESEKTDVEEDNSEEKEEEEEEEETEDEDFSYEDEYLKLLPKYELLKEENKELRAFKVKAERELEEEKIEELIEGYSLLLTKAEIEDAVSEDMTSDDVDVALSRAYAKKSIEEAKKSSIVKKDEFKMPGRENVTNKDSKKNRFAL